MTISYFYGPTLDDVMRSVINNILSSGIWLKPSKGGCTELMGVLLEITNPRARLSRTESRGKPFSSLGELCWYLSKTNALEFIKYYIPQYSKFADGDIIFGGYGPRLFDWRGIDQINQVIDLLRKNQESRRAVIQLFDARDITEEHKDVPCTCTIQFMIRNDCMHMVTYMRSNDVIIGLPHDVFCFTMLQEIVARTLSIELGSYKHSVGSIHLYDKNKDEALQYLNEGWQPTDMTMDPMPMGDPWPAIHSMLEAEMVLRTKGDLDIGSLMNLDFYWLDLIRLLQIFRYLKDRNIYKANAIRNEMSSSVYNSYIDKKLESLINNKDVI